MLGKYRFLDVDRVPISTCLSTRDMFNLLAVILLPSMQEVIDFMPLNQDMNAMPQLFNT